MPETTVLCDLNTRSRKSRRSRPTPPRILHCPIFLYPTNGRIDRRTVLPPFGAQRENDSTRSIAQTAGAYPSDPSSGILGPIRFGIHEIGRERHQAGAAIERIRGGQEKWGGSQGLYERDEACGEETITSGFRKGFCSPVSLLPLACVRQWGGTR